MLAELLSPVSESYLRKLLLESGLLLAPLVEGVNQSAFESLERTLLALEKEYAAGSPERRRMVRSLVLTARRHAEWNFRNPRASIEKKLEKLEMLGWLQVWLEDPKVFPVWLSTRKRVLADPSCQPHGTCL